MISPKIKKGTVVAVDFDGTLCKSRYPLCGKPIKSVINKIKRYRKAGAVVILWTCRQGKELTDALEWCYSYGLEFDYVNENDPKRIKAWGTDCRKVGADIYIDDKSINPCLFWRW